MSTRPTIRRGVLTATVAVLAVVLAVVVVATITMIVAVATGKAFTVQIPSRAVTGLTAATTGLVGGATLDPGGTVGVHIPAPTAAQSAWSLVIVAPIALVGITVLTLILLVVLRAWRGQPFTGRVVTTLRAVGLIELVSVPVAQILAAWAIGHLTASVTVGSVDFSPHLTGDWIVVGLGILALGEVIRRGQAIREELDEVI